MTRKDKVEDGRQNEWYGVVVLWADCTCKQYVQNKICENSECLIQQ